jgi:hypothetical protein
VETIVSNPGPSTEIVEPPKEEDLAPLQPKKVLPGSIEEADEDYSSSQELVDPEPTPRNSCCFYPRSLIKWLLT